MKTQFIFYSIFCCLFLTACSDFLDLKSNNKLAVPDKLEDLQALLDSFQGMNERRTPSYLEAAADDYFLTDSRYIATLEDHKPLYEWLPVESKFQNDWSSSYAMVYNANFCLDILKKIPKSEANSTAWSNIYGSSLFYRANAYLGLVWTYGAVFNPNGDNSSLSIVLREDSDFNKKSRLSSVAAVYERIVEDLKSAVDYLPELPKLRSRPSKAAVYALLARTYLSMSDYSNAQYYAELALSINSDIMDYNNAADGIKINDAVPFERFNKETIYYTDMALNFRLHVPTTGSYVDTALYNSYHTDDLRKTAFFRSSESYQRFKGTYSMSTSWLFTGLTTAEMFLIKIESMCRIGDFKSAINLLNDFRKYRWNKDRVFLELKADSRSEAIRIVLLERRKELLFRGLRLSDVKRQGLEDSSLNLKRKIQGRLVVVTATSDKLILGLPTDIVEYIK